MFTTAITYFSQTSIIEQLHIHTTVIFYSLYKYQFELHTYIFTDIMKLDN